MCAFGDGGKVTGGAAVFGYLLIAVFLVDMMINFNLAYYDETDEIIWDRRLIAKHYWKSGMLFVDFLGVFPFYVVVLAISGEIGNDNSLTQYLNLFRLIRVVRLYRVKQLYNTVRFSTKVSFMALTLSRNFLAGILWSKGGLENVSAICLLLFSCLLMRLCAICTKQHIGMPAFFILSLDNIISMTIIHGLEAALKVPIGLNATLHPSIGLLPVRFSKKIAKTLSSCQSDPCTHTHHLVLLF